MKNVAALRRTVVLVALLNLDYRAARIDSCAALAAP